jgi:hypothetical protein
LPEETEDGHESAAQCRFPCPGARFSRISAGGLMPAFPDFEVSVSESPLMVQTEEFSVAHTHIIEVVESGPVVSRFERGSGSI